MTVREAIRILDPATTRDALFGTEKEEGIRVVTEACIVAVKAMRKQESQRVIYHDNCGNKTVSARCPRCHEFFDENGLQKYCGFCGQKVKVV